MSAYSIFFDLFSKVCQNTYWYRNDSIMTCFAILWEVGDGEPEKLATYSTISKIFLVTPYELHFVEIQFKRC